MTGDAASGRGGAGRDGGRLAGKRALITGGAGGIGGAIARHFAREGARVTVTDIDGEGAAALAEEIDRETPGAAVSRVHDVTREADWAAALAAAEDAFGGLDILVNNAGAMILGSVEDTDHAAWRRVLEVNLDSVYLGCRLALPYLRASQPAAIVNISSISGLVAGRNMAAYNAAKAAVWMLTKSVALHAARDGDVRANSIHPSFVDTAMLGDVFARAPGAPLAEAERAKLARQSPLGRLCTVDDVAFAATYLASDESRFMTGAEIKLDGGLSAM